MTLSKVSLHFQISGKTLEESWVYLVSSSWPQVALSCENDRSRVHDLQRLNHTSWSSEKLCMVALWPLGSSLVVTCVKFLVKLSAPVQVKLNVFLYLLSINIIDTDTGIGDKYGGKVSYTCSLGDNRVLADLLARQSRLWAANSPVAPCTTCSWAIVGDESVHESSRKGYSSCLCDLLPVAWLLFVWIWNFFVVDLGI